MKKAISLILALVMCLSLCACGKKLTKEEMLSAAMDFDYAAFSRSLEENKLRTEEAYVGNTYKIEGFVKQINKNSCILGFLSSSGILEGDIDVPLSRDELKKINVNERIIVVGDISKISYGLLAERTTVKLGSAYYVGNEFKANVRIVSVIHSSSIDGRLIPQYATSIYRGYLDENVATYCDVYLSEENLTTLSEDDEITVVGKIVIYDDSKVVHMHYDTKIIFQIQDAELSN